MTPKCTNWRGHKFEARYSTGNPSVTNVKAGGAGVDAEVIAMVIEASKSKTYERDICVRCGVTVEKTPCRTA